MRAHAHSGPVLAACPSWAPPGSWGPRGLTFVAFLGALAGLGWVLGPWAVHEVCLAGAWQHCVDSSWSSSCALFNAGRGLAVARKRPGRCDAYHSSPSDSSEGATGCRERATRDRVCEVRWMLSLPNHACSAGFDRVQDGGGSRCLRRSATVPVNPSSVQAHGQLVHWSRLQRAVVDCPRKSRGRRDEGCSARRPRAWVRMRQRGRRVAVARGAAHRMQGAEASCRVA